MVRSFTVSVALLLGSAGSLSHSQSPRNPVTPRLSFVANFGPKGTSPVRFMAFDRVGNIYVAGSSASQIPLVSPIRATLGSGNCSTRPFTFFAPCSDLFLAKFDPSGQTILYSTYLGTDGRDAAAGLQVDGDGNVWLAGIETPPTFFGGETAGSAYVIRVNAAGSAVVYQRALGGTNAITGLAVDAQGNAFVTGVSHRDDFGGVNALQPRPLLKSIYATTDGGETWQARNTGLPAQQVYSMAIDPARPGTMYAATIRGLYKTITGGSAWTRVLPEASIAHRVVIGPNSTVYASYGDNQFEPIHLARSNDGGETWTSLSASIPRQHQFDQPQVIGAFALDPSNPAVIWVAGIGFQSQAILKSVDGGRQWTVMTESVRLFRAQETAAVLIAGSDGSRVAVCCREDPGNGSGLYITTDGGRTWSQGAPGPAAGTAGLWSPVLDPLDRTGQTIYAPWYYGLLRSTDFGRTWEDVALPPGRPASGYEPGSLAVDAASGALFLVNNSGVLFRSTNRRTWTSSNGPWGPMAKMLALDPARPTTNFYIASWSQPTGPDGHRHAFAAKLDPAGAVSWATLFGGSQVDEAAAIALDSEGNPVIGGRTNSPDLATTANALQSTRGRDFDGFIAKIASAGDRILYSTYLGGSSIDSVTALVTDRAGNVFAAGSTRSPDFPVTRSALQPRLTAMYTSGFAAKLEAGGQRLAYSTFLSGGDNDTPTGIDVDSAGGLWVTGIAGSGDFPLVRPLQPSAGPGRSSYVARLAQDGATLEFSTYLDETIGIKLDPAGNPWVHGASYDAGSHFLNSDDVTLLPIGYFAKLDLGPPPTATPGVPLISSMYNAASFRLADVVSPGGIGTLFGSELAPSTQAAQAPRLPRELAGVSVTIGGLAAPLYFVSPGQINYLVPVEIPLGTAELVVKRGEAASAARVVRVVAATPGIFTANGGAGTPFVVHASNYGLVTEQNPARPGEILVIFCAGLGPTNPPSVTGEPNPPMPAPLIADTEFYSVVESRVARTLYAGLAPGFAGLYQVNFQLWEDQPPGKKWIYVGGSNRVPIWVR